MSKEVEEIHYREVTKKKEKEGIDPVPGKRIFPLPDESNCKSDDESEEFEGGIFWKSFHRKNFNCKDFDELSRLMKQIPRICLQRKMKMGHKTRKIKLPNFCCLKTLKKF